MAKTVVGFYHDAPTARRVVTELRSQDFDDTEIYGEGGTAIRDNDDLLDHLDDAGVPENDARAYNQAVRRGGSLVTVFTDDDRASKAAAILNRYNPVDIGSEMGMHSAGTRDTATMRGEHDTRTKRSEHDTTTGRRDETIPIMEEELHVGKREVDKGTARIHTTIRERPVEERVTLREETVDVDRQRVDRPASKSDLDAFEERTIEVTQKAEEPVVRKEAHVTEEVTVRKGTREHQETVRDTVRSTDVEIEGVERGFRDHFDRTYAGKGGRYDEYRSAYRFGYELRNDNRLGRSDWREVEPEARRRWGDTGQDTAWDKVKDAVHEGFMAAREKVR